MGIGAFACAVARHVSHEVGYGTMVLRPVAEQAERVRSIFRDHDAGTGQRGSDFLGVRSRSPHIEIRDDDQDGDRARTGRPNLAGKRLARQAAINSMPGKVIALPRRAVRASLSICKRRRWLAPDDRSIARLLADWMPMVER